MSASGSPHMLRDLKLVQAMLENSADIWLACDFEGRIFYANQGAIRFLDLKENRFELSSLNKVFQLSVEQQESIKHCQKEGTTAAFAATSDRHGRIRSFWIELSPLKVTKTIGHTLSATDITKCQYESEKLIREHNLVNHIMEVSPVGITIVDREGHITFANSNAEKVLGLSNDNITERTYNGSEWRITDYDGNPFPDEELPYQKVKETGQAVCNVRHAIENPEGKRTLLSINATPIFNEEGLFDGMVATVEDVTEREIANEKLKNSEKKYNLLFHNLSDAVFVHDLRGKIMDFNKKAMSLFGYSREEFLDINISGLHPEDALEDSKKAFEKIVRDGFVNFKIRFVKKNGTVFLAEVSSTLFKINGENIVQGIVRDITDQHEAEEALRESEERFRIFFRTSPDVMTVSDLETGEFIDVNDGFVELSGYSRDEAIGHSALALNLWSDPSLRNTITAELKQRGIIKNMEVDFRHRDGTTISCLASSNIMRLQDKMYLFSVVRNIEDLKAAENAVRDSEERFRVSFKTSPDSMVLTELSTGKYIEVNDGFEIMTGFSKDEVIGLTAREIGIWVNQKKREQFVSCIMDKGYVRNIEISFRRKDGVIRSGLLSGHIIEMKGNKYLFTVARDIEDIKRTEEALRVSEQRFRTIFESAHDAIFIKDRNRKYVAVNPSMQRLFGFGAEQFIGKTYEDIFGKEGAEHNLGVEQRVLNGEIISEESRRTINGQQYIFNIITVPMRDEDRRIFGLCGIARDITETKKLQELAERAGKLEIAGRIAGQVAHDFNNLLGPLIAYPGLIRDELSPDHPAHVYLRDIEKAAEQMADINQQLLTLGRRAHYSQEPINLNDVIREAIERLRPEMGGISVEVDMQPDLMNISGGPAQIYRAISNLIKNATDAMPDGGRLTIRSENYYANVDTGAFDRVPRGEYAKITVSDTGAGISPEHLANIFDPFFSTKTADRKRGSGLGLSIVHTVVEDHQGHIDVDSQPGQGTSFYIYFPITRADADIPESRSIAGGSEKILVVDDDPIQIEVASRLLHKLGYLVSTAQSGEEALEMLRKDAQDLIIVDMVMTPGIDGADTFKEARKINPEQRAIVVSGFAETDRVKAALKLGAGLFLKKPLTLKALAVSVRKELDRKVEKTTNH